MILNSRTSNSPLSVMPKQGMNIRVMNERVMLGEGTSQPSVFRIAIISSSLSATVSPSRSLSSPQMGSGISQSTSFTRFYQRGDSTSTINRYSNTPSKNYNLNGRVMWSEPLALATYLQLSYQISYRYRDNQRNTYDLPGWIPNWDLAEWLWQDEYEQYLSERLSRFSIDEQLNQNIVAQFRRVTDNYNVNVGFELQPQTRHMDQQYQGIHIDTTRTVFNWTPTLNYRYRFTKQRSLNVNYRGRSQEPELTQLIEVVDDSNPMNITTGNAGLKPTFNNTLRVEFRDYNAEHLRNINVSLNAGNTLNNIVNQTTYNEETGGRITRPTNLDGFWSTWNAGTDFNFNTALTNQRFNVSTGTSFNYSHRESFLRSGALTLDNPVYPLATTHQIGVSQTLSGSYKNDWMDITIRGNVRYNHALNEMQPENKQDTWQFNYGPNANFNIPWQNIKISTNLSMNSRRGYSSAEFNTNELLWNAQISKSFLRMNAATVSLQFSGRSYTTEELIEIAKNVWKYDQSLFLSSARRHARFVEFNNNQLRISLAFSVDGILPYQIHINGQPFCFVFIDQCNTPKPGP